MRKFSIISLLLLSILVDHQAQGARLIKDSSLAEQHKVHEDKSDLSSSSIGVEDQVNPSVESHGSELGSNRKVMKKTLSPSSTIPTTTTTTSKNDKNDHQGNYKKAEPVLEGQSSSDRLGGKEENFSVNSSPSTHHPPETALDHYPDILDIAGMDYSPAKRKPPIHN
ncbi:unnamed protein product [Coffea canephora]|uniref:Uncharacterized protein n=2 Tax=Coffea TaxID=13442 RepID=A0A068UPM7_COFCA|nr:uncharacterized protein LOC113692423 [Coffea arabica]CDP10505.1 unnamed protein product [Coffea canephora]